MLTLDLGPALGVGVADLAVARCRLSARRCVAAPPLVRRAIIPGAVAVVVAGVFQELIQLMLQQYEGVVGDIRDFIYTWEGLSLQGAVIIFVVAALCSELIGARRSAARIARWPARDHRRERMIWAGHRAARAWCCCRRSPVPTSARC